MKKLLQVICILLFTVLALLPVAQADEVTYYIPDAQGSPVAAMDQTGAILWRKHYQPFGGELEPQAANNRVGFTGHVKDALTNLNYIGARYYDPQIGRFMSMDPAAVNPEDPRTFNRYNYANNNPYRYVDPDGRVPVLLLWGVSALLTIADMASNAPVPGHEQDGIAPVITLPGPLKLGGKVAAEGTDIVAKGAKDLKPTLIQENPRNLIPTQTKAEMSGSQVKRLTKDMKQNGYDQSKPVDAWRNPETGRLEIQDGHHRTEAAKNAGLDKIPVQVRE